MSTPILALIASAARDARDHGDAPAYANLLATLDQLAPDSAATIRAEVEGNA